MPTEPAPTAREWERVLLKSGEWLAAGGLWTLHRVGEQVGLADVYAWVDSGSDTVLRQEWVAGWTNDDMLPVGTQVAPGGPGTNDAPGHVPARGWALSGPAMLLNTTRDVAVALDHAMDDDTYLAIPTVRGAGVTVMGVVSQTTDIVTVRISAGLALGTNAARVGVFATY